MGDRGSNFGRDRPTFLKRIVAAPLPNIRQQVLVTRVLRDSHYKGLTRVTVGVER